MRRIPGRRSTRSVVIGLAALLAVGGIVGASVLDDPATSDTRSVLSRDGTSGEDDASAAFSVAPTAGARAEAGDVGPASAGGGGSVGAAPSLPPVDAGRVVKTARIELEVGEDGFDAARDRAVQAVADAGGFVQDSTLQSSRASLTFRVPADRFEGALTRLRELGEVKDETVTGEDVSEEYVDLDSRLRHWKAQEAVFLDLLSKARTVGETVEIRRELSMIQQTIEQLQGRIRFLDDRTGFSTVTLEMFVPGAGAVAPDGSGPSLSKAWDEAWDAAVTVVGGTLITLGVLVPLSAIAGLVALVGWVAFRRRRPPAATPAT